MSATVYMASVYLHGHLGNSEKVWKDHDIWQSLGGLHTHVTHFGIDLRERNWGLRFIVQWQNWREHYLVISIDESPSCWQHLSLLQIPSTSAHNDHQIFGSGCLSCGNMYCFFVLAISRGMVQVEQHGSRTFVCHQVSTTALFFNGENWRKIQPHTVFHRARPLYRPLWVIWPRNSATNFNPYSSLSRYTVCSLYERQYTWLQHIHRIQSDLDGMGDSSIN